MSRSMKACTCTSTALCRLLVVVVVSDPFAIVIIYFVILIFIFIFICLLLLLLLSNIYYQKILGFWLLHFPWKSVEWDSVFQILKFCCSRGHNCGGKLVEIVNSKGVFDIIIMWWVLFLGEEEHVSFVL
jgi:hypothetical protein